MRELLIIIGCISASSIGLMSVSAFREIHNDLSERAAAERWAADLKKLVKARSASRNLAIAENPDEHLASRPQEIIQAPSTDVDGY